ncbi:MAG: hypothetical protein Q8N96_04075 [Methylovulum sp.]|nr:hypothetical protein [Methylovulum sp.]
MNNSQENKCHAIIHSTATICAGVGAGMAQVPGSDSLVIVPIQIGMIISLGAVFGIELDESAAKATLATATATMVGRGISQALVGWIPGWGNALNALTASAVTESVGWAIANDFATKKSLSHQR